jgi:hypothetical protein
MSEEIKPDLIQEIDILKAEIGILKREIENIYVEFCHHESLIDEQKTEILMMKKIMNKN